MRTIARVFGRSPFVPLQGHMEKVAQCVHLLPELFDAWYANNDARVNELCDQISHLEYEADQIKHDIRDSLPRGLFMPIDRASLLTILNVQDGIANRAENIGVLLTFKQAKHTDALLALFRELVAKAIEAFTGVRGIIDLLDELLETGFGGAEAVNVRKMVDRVAQCEHEADVMQREILRELLSNEADFSYGDFFMWTRIIRQVAQLADRSDNLASSIRTTLESK